MFQQVLPSRNEAFRAERQVKGWSRAKNEALIEALIKGQWQDISAFAKAYVVRSSIPGGRPSTGSGGAGC